MAGGKMASPVLAGGSMTSPVTAGGKKDYEDSRGNCFNFVPYVPEKAQLQQTEGARVLSVACQ